MSRQRSLSRRTFLRLLAASGASGLVSGLAAGCSTRAIADGGSGRVLVVGAGVAGLGAARALRRQQFEVVVLEGRHRVGGRLYTSDALDVPIDLGASWIEGDRGNPISELLGEFGIRTLVDDPEGWYVYRDGKEVAESDLERLQGLLEEILGRALARGEELDEDIGLGHALSEEIARRRLPDLDRAGLEWLLGTMETDTAEDLDQVSLWNWDEDEEFDGESLLFPGGFEQVARGLARGLDVRLGQQVTRIAATRDGVRVTSRRTPDAASCAGACHGGVGVSTAPEVQELEADWCIVTVPLGVLKRGAIAFDPPLPPAKREVIERLGMGVLDIVALRFERAFWPEDATYLSAISGTRGDFPEILCCDRLTGAPVLKGFAGGRFARETESEDLEAVTDRFLRTLRHVTGRRVPDPIAAVRSRWGLDHWTYGSYVHTPPGTGAAHHVALAAPTGRVLFAGEATSEDYPGTVHGAYLSGLREARRIAEAAGED